MKFFTRLACFLKIEIFYQVEALDSRVYKILFVKCNLILCNVPSSERFYYIHDFACIVFIQIWFWECVVYCFHYGLLNNEVIIKLCHIPIGSNVSQEKARYCREKVKNLLLESFLFYFMVVVTY